MGQVGGRGMIRTVRVTCAAAVWPVCWRRGRCNCWPAGRTWTHPRRPRARRTSHAACAPAWPRMNFRRICSAQWTPWQVYVCVCVGESVVVCAKEIELTEAWQQANATHTYTHTLILTEISAHTAAHWGQNPWQPRSGVWCAHRQRFYPHSYALPIWNKPPPRSCERVPSRHLWDTSPGNRYEVSLSMCRYRTIDKYATCM